MKFNLQYFASSLPTNYRLLDNEDINKSFNIDFENKIIIIPTNIPHFVSNRVFCKLNDENFVYTDDNANLVLNGFIIYDGSWNQTNIDNIEHLSWEGKITEISNYWNGFLYIKETSKWTIRVNEKELRNVDSKKVTRLHTRNKVYVVLNTGT